MQKKQKQNPIDAAIAWHSLPIKAVLEHVKSRSGGLVDGEIADHRRLFGENRLPQALPPSALSVLLSQLASPLVYVLLFAALVSWSVGHRLEVVVILAAISVNTLVGFWQEYKADQALQRLTRLLQQFATIERDGRQQRVAAGDIVVGDIVLLHAGDKVPADARLLEANRLATNEASLTGESLNTDKRLGELAVDLTVGDRRNMVFGGTIVTQGTGRAVVVAVGPQTQIGTIAGLVSDTKQDVTPLQKQLKSLSRFLTVIVIGAALFMFALGSFYRIPFEELIVVASALAVAAIPEGLLVSLTIVLVIGMQRLLRKRGLIRKLLAAETLGSVTVVCTDKTGTLTKGVMQVARIVVHGETHPLHENGKSHEAEYEEQHLHALKVGMLCNDSYIKNPQDDLNEWELVGDQTDAALLLAGIAAGFDRERLHKEYLRLDAIPFDERYKYMATLHHVTEQTHQIFVKGAPETVLAMCSKAMADGDKKSLTPSLLGQLQEEYRSLAKQGLRVLAIASREVKPDQESFADMGVNAEQPLLKDLVFDGWVGLKDPVRPDARRVFATMEAAGIRPIIITGDHPETVRAVASELGWQVPDSALMTGAELDDLPVDQLIPFVQHTQVFARVEPKHKLRIIQALQQSGEVVAMFGDGVNDAPALKAADIAVVVNSGTDIAKETADLVLLDDQFAVITSAVKEGRTIFDNIRLVFLFLVCDSFAEVVIIILAMIFALPIPLTALQILWMNLLSDTLPNLSLTLEEPQANSMKQSPRERGNRIVNGEMKRLLFITTIAASLAGFLLYVYTLRTTGDLALARTVVFCMVALDSMFYVFSIRRLGEPLYKTGFLQNKALLAAISFTVVAQLFVVYVPFMQTVFETVAMRPIDWALVVLFGCLQLVIIETFKWYTRHRVTT